MRTLALLALCCCLLPAQSTVTIAGTGSAGFSGDGGPATQAQINNPYGLVVGPDGALYFCEIGNHRVRRLDLKTHSISTVAGSGQKGYSGDGGPALQASLNEPYEVGFDAAGNMYFAEMQNHVVRRVDAKTRIITTVAGTGSPGFGGIAGRLRKVEWPPGANGLPVKARVMGKDDAHHEQAGVHRRKLAIPGTGPLVHREEMIVEAFVAGDIRSGALNRIVKEFHSFQRDLSGFVAGDPFPFNSNGKTRDCETRGSNAGRRPAGRAVLYDAPIGVMFLEEEEKGLLLD